MRLREIVQFVEGTADPAFAVDGIGNIVAWNHASAETFGISSAEAIGKLCDEVIRGTDDCGELCSSNCVIQQCVGKHQLMHNFDLQIDTQQGKKWFNTSVITVDSTTSTRPYIIHILRLIDIYKRLEMILRDFIVNATNISQKQVTSLILSSKSVFQDAYLTKREIEVLRFGKIYRDRLHV